MTVRARALITVTANESNGLGSPLISTEAQLRAAIVAAFLRNADSGAHDANDEIVHEMIAAIRRRQQAG